MQTPSQWVQTCAIQTSAKMVRAVQAAASMRRRACDAKSQSAGLIYLAQMLTYIQPIIEAKTKKGVYKEQHCSQFRISLGATTYI